MPGQYEIDRRSYQGISINIGDLLGEICVTMNLDLERIDHAIGTELWSVLKRVDNLLLDDYDNPVLRQVFKWLVEPQRTVQEFICVVGPLLHYPQFKFSDEFLEFGQDFYCHLGVVAAEALAARSPILQGDWEDVAWLILARLLEAWFDCPNDELPKQVCDWIIWMMGDSNFCPSPYLRIVFLDVYSNLVDGVVTHNEADAFNSAIFICSSLNMIDSSVENKYISYKDIFCSIISLLDRFTEGYIENFDNKLSNKLWSSVTDLTYDDSRSFLSNPHTDTGAYEISAVAGLFKCISAYARHTFNKFREPGVVCNVSIGINSGSHQLKSLLTMFKKSSQTPQLIVITTVCVMDVLELVFLINIVGLANIHKQITWCVDNMEAYLKNIYRDIHLNLRRIDQLFKGLGDQNVGSDITDLSLSASPVVEALKLKHQERLGNLRQQVCQLSVD